MTEVETSKCVGKWCVGSRQAAGMKKIMREEEERCSLRMRRSSHSPFLALTFAHGCSEMFGVGQRQVIKSLKTRMINSFLVEPQCKEK